MAFGKQATSLYSYQMKITLIGSEPSIWRRIQVPGDISLQQLHEILQIVMGWTDTHLHQFIIGGHYFALPDPEYDPEMENESVVRLNQVVAGPDDRFIYEYDFGDNWEHEILIERVLPLKRIMSHPVCLMGKGDCPPEDFGGTEAYNEYLRAIQSPDHPEHGRTLDGLEGGEGDFDPEAFNLAEINRKLEKAFRQPKVEGLSPTHYV